MAETNQLFCLSKADRIIECKTVNIPLELQHLYNLNPLHDLKKCTTHEEEYCFSESLEDRLNLSAEELEGINSRIPLLDNELGYGFNDLSTLHASAKKFGIPVSREKDEALNAVVSEMYARLKSDGQNDFLNFATRNPFLGSASAGFGVNPGNQNLDATRKALQPTDVPFTDQAQMATDLNKLSTQYMFSKAACERFVILMGLQIVRLSKTYNYARWKHDKERGRLAKELDDLQMTQEVIDSMIAIRDERSEYELERLPLTSAIDQCQDDAEKLKTLREQRGALNKNHIKNSSLLLVNLRTSVDNQDKDAMTDCMNRSVAHDHSVFEKLQEMLDEIIRYRIVIKTMSDQAEHCRKEQKACMRDAKFATLLDLLGEPLEFFNFPREIRNMVYKILLKSTTNLTITTYTPLVPKPTLKKHRFERKGSYKLVTHELFGICRRFRAETMECYYRSNSFTSGSIWEIEKDLGLKVLKSALIACISTLNLVWTSLGPSTVHAVKVLRSLPGLQRVNIYINWKEVGGYKSHENITVEGITHFRQLLNARTSEDLPLQVNVYPFTLLRYEDNRLARALGRGAGKSLEILREAEIVLNELFSQRLTLNGSSVAPKKPYSGLKLALMTKEELSAQLDQMLVLAHDAELKLENLRKAALEKAAALEKKYLKDDQESEADSEAEVEIHGELVDATQGGGGQSTAQEVGAERELLGAIQGGTRESTAQEAKPTEKIQDNTKEPATQNANGEKEKENLPTQ